MPLDLGSVAEVHQVCRAVLLAEVCVEKRSSVGGSRGLDVRSLGGDRELSSVAAEQVGNTQLRSSAHNATS
jgi:hypothetical protein